MDKPWHLVIMALFYVIAGLNHFIKNEIYCKIIPSFIKDKVVVNELVGFIEILLGIFLLIPIFSSLAAISIMILLVCIFPANIYMLTNEKAHLGLPKWVLILRLPIQFLLIFWAYQYANFSIINL
ncbi:DoxX family protein [Flavobacterium sp. SUN052]|uniref:DoxX family protein n=1 Tax=Flavobacterium sp. SUN052 TaxID=3002441 RepID=UPI00237EC385|nr:DoxX family protein [Flavobacterium sp. SUN052]MEC4005291.1 DoxX family protein [Flavobacterium sp. SUN052]